MPTDKEVGIRRIPAYTLHYTTEFKFLSESVQSIMGRRTNEDMLSLCLLSFVFKCFLFLDQEGSVNIKGLYKCHYLSCSGTDGDVTVTCDSTVKALAWTSGFLAGVSRWSSAGFILSVLIMTRISSKLSRLDQRGIAILKRRFKRFISHF